MDSLRQQPVLRRRSDRLVSVIDRLALLVAWTVALIIPVGYASLEYGNLVFQVDTQAQVKAGAITALVSANPRFWSYQVQRMEEMLAHYPAPIDDEAASVYDANGVLLVRAGGAPEPPVLRRSHPLHDSGRIVGRVEIAHSLRGLIYGAVLAALLGLVLGGATYSVMRTWPLRTLRRMNDALVAEHAALRGSEERFRDLFDRASDGIMIFSSSSGKILAVNTSFARMHGYSAEEMLNMSLKDLDAPETAKMTPERLQRVKSGEAMSFEVGHYHKDGHIISLEVSTSLVVSGGEPLIQAFHRDITERRRAEKAYQEREAQLREAQRIAGIGSWEHTLGSDAVTWSEGLHLILGRDPGLGPPTFATLPRYYTPGSWERLRAAIARAIEAGVPYELELEMIRADGAICWTTTRGEVVRAADGAVVKLRGTVHDITARKRAEAGQAQLEARLRESQKMEALGTLAGGIAHDFNNIIAAINGNLELARQDVGSEHAALESLEEIRKASRRAQDLVRQILAFGRRQGLDRKVISLAPVVEESAQLLRTTLLGVVTLDVECAAETPAVLADATQIQQVLLNLCTNAWQAMRGMGRPGVIEIRLQAHCVDAAPQDVQERRSGNEGVLLRPGRYARLTVRDNGLGMDEATRLRMFEPFFTTKPVGEGTGLGLAVVYGIVQAHEARIEVESEPGKGATFSVYFPAAEAAAVAEKEPLLLRGKNGDTLALQRAGKHILYVDDDEAIVYLMRRLLERQGYRVSGYTDALEAVAAVRAEPGQFDLAVTDYNMPHMSGLEVAQALRKLRADLPVVLASGYITEELRLLAPAAGVRKLIFKPNTVEELCGVVAGLANGAERMVSDRTKV